MTDLVISLMIALGRTQLLHHKRSGHMPSGACAEPQRHDMDTVCLSCILGGAQHMFKVIDRTQARFAQP